MNLPVHGTLRDAMVSAGLAPTKALDLHPDGKIHRYRVTGDKGGSLNGWYVLHGGALAFGAFGSWKTGESHAWRKAVNKPQSPAERAEMAQCIKAMRQARDDELKAVQAAARAKAARLWRMARPACNDHPYLVRKRVAAIGIRRLRDMLLIPARDVQGQLHSLQFIGDDGSKRFLTGGRLAACYFSMGRPVDRLLLCEGLATGSTLFAATGSAVAVCFSAGNLLPVARALREKFPRLRLIVCGDNDHATPGNPGLTKAQEAARAVGVLLAFPQFKGVAA